MREIKAIMDNEGVLHYDKNGNVVVTIIDDPNTKTCSINVGELTIGYCHYDYSKHKVLGVIQAQLEYDDVIMKSLNNLLPWI